MPELRGLVPAYTYSLEFTFLTTPLLSNSQEPPMAKPGRKVKKANHGKRPACSRPRKNRRQKVRT
jgi:hypothetical protein